MEALIRLPLQLQVIFLLLHSVEISGFSITQILREINLRVSGSAKSAILTHLEALYLDFYEFLQFLKAQIDQINKIQSP